MMSEKKRALPHFLVIGWDAGTQIRQFSVAGPNFYFSTFPVRADTASVN